MYGDRDLVVKCAPGIDFDQLRRLGFAGEIEVTSLAGSVREACLWSAGLAEIGGHPAGDDPGPRRRQITDADPDDCTVAPAGRWIVDPDGAVVRAGLVRHYGARHGLWQLDPDIAYLSGDELPDGVRGFEVLEELDYSERRLRQALSAHDVGRRRDPGSRRRRRPRRVAGAAAAARVATARGGDHPNRSGCGKPGGGLRLPSVP